MIEAAENIETLEVEEIERIAVELATLAGAEIQAALGSMIAVRYKGESPEKTLWRDPVSEVDQRVETLIRARVTAILDAEVVCVGSDGVADFDALYSRVAGYRAVACAFHLLKLDGDDLRRNSFA